MGLGDFMWAFQLLPCGRQALSGLPWLLGFPRGIQEAEEKLTWGQAGIFMVPDDVLGGGRLRREQSLGSHGEGRGQFGTAVGPAGSAPQRRVAP